MSGPLKNWNKMFATDLAKFEREHLRIDALAKQQHEKIDLEADKIRRARDAFNREQAARAKTTNGSAPKSRGSGGKPAKKK